jgi:hypothetical protein
MVSPQHQGCVAMYLAALACDGHFDADAQRLPTVQRDTQEAKNMKHELKRIDRPMATVDDVLN